MRAFITGITGQDGSYLAEQLLADNYDVIGLLRRSSSGNTPRINHLIKNPRLSLVYGDLQDSGSLHRYMSEFKPDEVYNLGAQSHVHVSYDCPSYTFDVVANGTLNLLEAIRLEYPAARMYQAGSSEQYGKNIDVSGFQDETTTFHPVSPYAVAKTAAYHLVQCYRESYGLFVCNGILFNHESPRRGDNFLTKKVTKYVGQLIASNNKKFPKLQLGNLTAKRDWGYAPDYTHAMSMMLRQEAPGDYVIATGDTYSVHEFVETAFGVVDLNWQDFVDIDASLFRPSEVPTLRGNAYKAKTILGWEPSITFRELVELMVGADIEEAKKQARFEGNLTK